MQPERTSGTRLARVPVCLRSCADLAEDGGHASHLEETITMRKTNNALALGLSALVVVASGAVVPAFAEGAVPSQVKSLTKNVGTKSLAAKSGKSWNQMGQDGMTTGLDIARDATSDKPFWEKYLDGKTASSSGLASTSSGRSWRDRVRQFLN
jgi:hypothetical protein